jgi:cobalamin biosynthesis Mg chelatase CobN
VSDENRDDRRSRRFSKRYGGMRILFAAGSSYGRAGLKAGTSKEVPMIVVMVAVVVAAVLVCGCVLFLRRRAGSRG